MTDFVRVASASQIADPSRELVELDDRVLVLLKVDGRFYCWTMSARTTAGRLATVRSTVSSSPAPAMAPSLMSPPAPPSRCRPRAPRKHTK
jgi:hypothetical protein